MSGQPDPAAEAVREAMAALGWQPADPAEGAADPTWRLWFQTSHLLVSGALTVSASNGWAAWVLTLGAPVPEPRREAMARFALDASFGLPRGTFELQRNTGLLRFRVGMDLSEHAPCSAERLLAMIRPATATVLARLDEIHAVRGGAQTNS